ncbi:MAG TPA: N-formylglutamate amidohydrolase, partial [Casimicrobiaceae bacterium]|nr:N-formylglutamate amidohydrolase [Casimicrobiaceae bacterium]
RNYPYRGRSDALTRYLRERFDAAAYAGIELEINQRHVRNGGAIAAPQRAAVALALRDALRLPGSP